MRALLVEVAHILLEYTLQVPLVLLSSVGDKSPERRTVSFLVALF
jgi:hypothetical protein